MGLSSGCLPQKPAISTCFIFLPAFFVSLPTLLTGAYYWDPVPHEPLFQIFAFEGS